MVSDFTITVANPEAARALANERVVTTIASSGSYGVRSFRVDGNNLILELTGHGNDAEKVFFGTAQKIVFTDSDGSGNVGTLTIPASARSFSSDTFLDLDVGAARHAAPIAVAGNWEVGCSKARGTCR